MFDAERVGETLMDITPGLPETDNFLGPIESCTPRLPTMRRHAVRFVTRPRISTDLTALLRTRNSRRGVGRKLGIDPATNLGTLTLRRREDLVSAGRPLCIALSGRRRWTAIGLPGQPDRLSRSTAAFEL